MKGMKEMAMTGNGENSQRTIAHVRQTESGEWLTHDLYDHLRGTARRAGEFAAERPNSQRPIDSWDFSTRCDRGARALRWIWQRNSGRRLRTDSCCRSST
jgi:hypothetical protein